VDWLSDWILTLIIFLPLVGAGLICLLPSSSADAIRRLALLTAVVTLALTVVALWMFFGTSAPQTGGYALEKSVQWIGGGDGPLAVLDIRYHVGLDGVSVWLFALTALLTPLAIWASFSAKAIIDLQ